jgi:hypothetical protein
MIEVVHGAGSLQLFGDVGATLGALTKTAFVFRGEFDAFEVGLLGHGIARLVFKGTFARRAILGASNGWQRAVYQHFPVVGRLAVLTVWRV